MYEPAILKDDTTLRAWWYLARSVYRVMNQLAPAVEEFGITGPQFGVIRTLAEAGPDGLPLGQLSERLLVSCGNITGIVDRLEDGGHLYRERSPDDRRVVIARLTEKGAALHQRALPVLMDAVRAALAGLDMDEQAALGSLAMKLELSLLVDALPPVEQPELAEMWRS